jgi:hypothetical protein
VTVVDGGGQPPEVSALATVLAETPTVFRRLLAVHVPDRVGRCTGCTTASGVGETWPCRLHDAADDAARLHAFYVAQVVGPR